MTKSRRISRRKTKGTRRKEFSKCITTKKPVRVFISRRILNCKEKAKEQEKKIPAKSGWEQLKDKHMMLKLKT